MSTVLSRHQLVKGWDQNLIGRGNFGKIFKAQLWTGSARIEAAVKVAHDSPNEELAQELAILSIVGSHPHILQLIGAIYADDSVELLVVELCELGSLADHLVSLRAPSLSEAYVPVAQVEGNDKLNQRLQSYAWQISDGMKHLAAKGIIHRDLAARNILVSRNEQLKVADFGLSKQRYYRMNPEATVPLFWMPPEALEGDFVFTEKSDIWSFGVLLWEIFTLGERPYKDNMGPNQIKIPLNQRIGNAPLATDEMSNLTIDCWNPESEARPNFAQVELRLRNLTGSEETSVAQIQSYILGPSPVYSSMTMESEQQTVQKKFLTPKRLLALLLCLLFPIVAISLAVPLVLLNEPTALINTTTAATSSLLHNSTYFVWRPFETKSEMFLGEKILIIGGLEKDGEQPLSTMEWFSIGNSSENRLLRATLSPPRRGHITAVLDDGTVLIAGGDTGEGLPQSMVLLDPLKEVQRPGPSLNVRRFGAAAAVINGIIYVCGGTAGKPTDLSSCEQFQSGTWKSIAPMIHRRQGLTMVALHEKLYAIGGWADTVSFSLMEAYDIKSDRWTKMASMTKARDWLAAAIWGENIIACGGVNGLILNFCEEYNVETDQWRPIAPMRRPRFGLSLVRVANGLLAIGGHSSNDLGDLAEDTVEFYDPGRNEWTLLPEKLVTPRRAFTAVLLGEYKNSNPSRNLSTSTQIPNQSDPDYIYEDY